MPPHRKISNSEVNDADLCKRKYHNTYVLNGGLAAKSVKGALAKGIAGHIVLERYFQGRKEGETHNDARSAAQATLLGLIKAGEAKSGFHEDALWAAKRTTDLYFRKWGDHAGWQFLEVEKQYEMPLPNKNYSIPIKIDLLVYDEKIDKIRLVDNKWTYNFWPLKKFTLRAQFPKYVAVLRYNGINVHDVIINQIRYREMKSEDLDDYVKRTEYQVTNQKIQRTLRDHMQTSDWIQHYRSLTAEDQDREATYILNDLVCKFCAFSDLCEAQLDGAYVDQIIAADFKPNDYGYNFDAPVLESF
jgi:hypothetical protein